MGSTTSEEQDAALVALVTLLGLPETRANDPREGLTVDEPEPARGSDTQWIVGWVPNPEDLEIWLNRQEAAAEQADRTLELHSVVAMGDGSLAAVGQTWPSPAGPRSMLEQEREQERDEARAVARQLCRDAGLSLGEEYAARYPWLKEAG